MSPGPSPAPLRFSVVTVGSELVTGQRLDTNSRWLATRLEGLGYQGWTHASCPDDVPTIQATVSRAAAEADVVVVTGGLGPTMDDLTRESIAAALGVSLVEHAPSWDHIQALFAKFGREPTESNRRQATLPAGARVLNNDVGTAPGFAVELNGTPVYCLPGVPREMRWMWQHHLADELGRAVPGELKRAEWTGRSVGIAESALGERLRPLEQEPGVEVRYATEEELGTIQVTILAQGRGGQTAGQRLEDLAQRARELIGHHLAAEGAETLAGAVGRRLAELNRTLVTAESCTGGRVASLLTELAGISAVFLEGVVSYSNQAKTRLLGVPAELIEAHGAVSEPVARAMAEGARARAEGELALAITGIAGPGGGSEEKPVGLVHFALARRDRETVHAQRQLPGERTLIQARATAFALDLVRRHGLD